MFPHRFVRPLAALCALTLLAACQGPVPRGRLVIAGLPASLAEPEAYDWSLPRFASRALATRQADHFRAQLLAYPDSTPAWAGGLSLAGYGCASDDSAPNGPAAAYPASGVLVNKLFFLTRAGVLIKVDRLDPTVFAKVDLGRTCSRTAVTLSPFSTRAYVLADDGTLQIIDTATMAVKATIQVPGGYGIAPAVDRVASAPNDARDILYVPANDGTVRAYVVERTSTAPYLRVSSPTVHDVAGAVTPLVGAHKVAAPALAHGGVLYLGDQAGNFHVYDTTNPAASFVYGVGAPVNTPPSLVLQDGTYDVTDPDGNPKPVSYGEPVHAFVTAGAACAWINLHDASATYSPALRIDDNDPTRKFGYLLDYPFSTAGTVETIVADDGGNINTEAPERALPGHPTIWSNDYLVPAATNTVVDAGEAAGGPVVSYLRFRAGGSTAGALIAQAKLSLTAAFDQGCRPAGVKATAPYYRGTVTPWASDGLTNENRPVIGEPNVGRFLSGGISSAGNVTFKKSRTYEWDVTSAFSTSMTRYALALDYDGFGDAVLWPEGPVGGATGKKAKKAYQVEAVKFFNNARNADASPAVPRDQRPLLSLTLSSTALPTPTLETPPVVDPVNRRVYVFYTNAVYAMDFTSPVTFSDVDPSGARHTLFNVAHFGDAANGGGATHDGRRRFVANLTAPLLNHDFTAAYVLSRYPAVDAPVPSTWRYALGKMTLPLSPTADCRVANPPTFEAVAGGASAAMLMDPLNKVRTGGNVYVGLGDGKLYQVQP